MKITHLVRDAGQVHKILKEVNNSLITTHPCKIYVPEHYMNSALGNIGNTISIVGIFAIVVDDKYYAVSNAIALMTITPSGSNIVDIEGEKYMEFSFQKNETVIKNLNLIRMTTLVYRVYNEIIPKGKVPWYLSYQDLCFLFETAQLHGNVDLRTDSALLELIITTMARTKEDKTVFYRQNPKLKDASYHDRPFFIPLSSVAFNATSTTSRLLGAYFNTGLTSALVTPTESISTVEDVLRK